MRAQAMHDRTMGLVWLGHADDHVERIRDGNVLRVFNEVRGG